MHLAVDPGLAGRRPLEAEHDPRQRRLAGARLADHGGGRAPRRPRTTRRRRAVTSCPAARGAGSSLTRSATSRTSSARASVGPLRRRRRASARTTRGPASHRRRRVHEAAGVLVLRVAQDLRGRPCLDDSPVEHDDDAVGPVGREPEVVRDEHQRGAVRGDAASPGGRGSGAAPSRRARSSARRRRAARGGGPGRWR